VIREAMELADAGVGVDDSESLMRLVHVRALTASGDPEGARRALEAARARLGERANRIGDAELRRSFLTEVRANAETAAFAL
jgi:eukaryotic-like serine/threonine-protein kinase